MAVLSERFTLPPEPPGFQVHEAWLDGYVHQFSASGLRLLKVCPEAWRQRYVLGRKERPGEALVLGSAFHSAMSYTHTQKIESHEDRPVPEVVEYLHDKAWPDAVGEHGEDQIRWDGKPDEVRRDAERVTRAYHEEVSPRIQPIAVEKKVEFVVPGVPIKFVGYLDVEEASHVIDTKTGKQVQRKPDANWRTQGMIYTAATGKPTHFHSASRAKTPSLATPLTDSQMVVSLVEAQRPYVETMLSHYAAEVEWFFYRHGPHSAWPTTGVLMDYKGGPACNYCGFRKDCPAWAWQREVVQPVQIPTDMTDINGAPIMFTPS